MQLTLAIYALTKDFPKDELFGLTSQMRRAAVSILSNIAEGHGRSSRTQLAHFISIAKGSCFELEAQLCLVHELGYGSEINRTVSAKTCRETGRMLHAMLKSLQSPPISENLESGT